MRSKTCPLCEKKAFVCQVLVIDATETDGKKSIDLKYDLESNWY